MVNWPELGLGMMDKLVIFSIDEIDISGQRKEYEIEVGVTAGFIEIYDGPAFIEV